MVFTDLLRMACSGRLYLAVEFHGQALGRELDGRERVLDFVREAARDLAPGLGALGGHHFRDVVEHQQAFVVGQQGAARDEGDAFVEGRGAVRAELEGLLPVAAFVLRLVGQEALELLQHAAAKGLQSRHLGQWLAHVHGQRRVQDARRAGVDAAHTALLVEHDDTGGEVVQDGLQVVARGVHLLHALLHRGARVREVLCHVREGAREARELVARGQCGLGREVAGRHFAHALGEHEQRAHQLVAQQHGQQHGAEHGEEQRQRERADVHAAQTFAGERALLVLAVGDLHGQRVRHQRTGSGATTCR